VLLFGVLTKPNQNASLNCLKLPFTEILYAAPQSVKADIDVLPQHYRSAKILSADGAPLSCGFANGCLQFVTKIICSAPNLSTRAPSTIPCAVNKRQEAEFALCVFAMTSLT
jgi:hypothetical protein